MSTAPIINVINVASSSAAATKANAPSNSSDQSFGQVLSREVNGRNNASGEANSGQASQTSSTTTTNTPSSSGGKSVKTKSNSDSSQADSNSSNKTNDAQNGNQGQLTQMLALVANAQPGAPGSSTQSPVTNNLNPIGTITSADKLAIDRAVGADKLATPLATDPAALQSSAAADGELPITATGAQSNAAIEVTSQPTMDTVLKTTILPNASTEQATNKTADIGNIQQTPGTLSSQIDAADKSALDLNAISEKNIQSGLAALNSNAVKVGQAVQTTPTITATALPSIAGQALPSDPNDKLTPQVGSAGWDQSLGQKVVWMVAGGQQNASLTLNPPDLGPMQVVLNVTNSHATVTFTSTQPEVRQALESAIPKLREMLGDAGIQLGQASINSGSAQQQNFSQQNSRNTHSVSSSGESTDATISTIRTLPSSAGQGLVDTFA